MLMVRGHLPYIEKGPWEPEDESWLDLTGRDSSCCPRRPLNSNQPWKAKGSSLICTNFSDKLNLKIQLKCNQRSEPTRKSLASLGARKTMSHPKEARECAGLHQDAGPFLFCYQHEIRPMQFLPSSQHFLRCFGETNSLQG